MMFDEAESLQHPSPPTYVANTKSSAEFAEHRFLHPEMPPTARPRPENARKTPTKLDADVWADAT